ncbi:MAG: single-stranded-DNA-specific exonuclease RecJ [Candidatus Saccharibacteria bacterium]|nr:single-stranded-DNA-specific exonuclease RecJ [Candidatus Saccharibacteria bacterium]
MNQVFKKLLSSRGLKTEAQQKAFLNPNYDELGDPNLLPDMKKAVKRLQTAHKNKEKVVIYGDYDIDGLSATTLLLDAFTQFGFDVATFIPSRFDDGYGLSSEAIDRLAADGAQLIVTVDCGSLSFDEIVHAKKIGVEVIVTDHHNLGEKLPDAVAVINPKRTDHKYPFRDFSGVGVAFGLVRALQSTLKGLDIGYEKWLLDLVALGTICDIVPLVGENRTLAFWGLKVMSQTRRPGIRALLAVSKINPAEINARSLGFGLGPRLNASGRLETAQLSLDLLTTTENGQALQLATELDSMNQMRRKEQNRIFEEATLQVSKYTKDEVLVLSSKNWNHGIVGIVAAKILEAHKKPTFVMQEIGDETKGSARSFGDYSVGNAIRYSETHIIKGGGHNLAAGVTLKTTKITKFRASVNEYYQSLNLKNQKAHLLPKAEITVDSFNGLDEALVEQIGKLEPFGEGNLQPVFLIENLTVAQVRKMGDQNQHIKLKLRDKMNNFMEFLAFSAPEHYFIEPGQQVSAWCTLDINEWMGNRNVEGRLLELTAIN